MQPRGQFETSVDAGSNETALKRAEPGRSRVRLLAARGLAALLLVFFAALLALPLQAQAQTPPCDALWCATLTVGQDGSIVGFSNGDSGTFNIFGALSPSQFPYDGATIGVNSLVFSSSDGISYLFFELTGSVGSSDYTLKLDDESFILSGTGGFGFFEISASPTFANGETVTVKLFEGLEGGTLSDDATLSGLSFEFVNLNPDVPMDETDTVTLSDVLTPLFDPDITEYTATIPARMDILLIGDGAVPTASGATVVFTMNRNVIDLGGGEEGPLRAGTNFLRFEVTAPDGMTTKVYVVTVKRFPFLKASFAVPESHDGSTPFTVTLKFNEDISSALSNVAAAVVVTNGTKGAVIADGSSTRRFLIPVTPDSSKPVRIRVRNANHCDQSHAVCAVSGKIARNGVQPLGRRGGRRDAAGTVAQDEERLLDPKETGVPAGYHLVPCRGCQWCRRDKRCRRPPTPKASRSPSAVPPAPSPRPNVTTAARRRSSTCRQARPPGR